MTAALDSGGRGLLGHAAGGLVVAFVCAVSSVVGACLGGVLLFGLGNVLFALVDLPDLEAQAIFLGWCGSVVVPACAVLVATLARLDLAQTNAPAAPAGRWRYALRWSVVMHLAPLAAFLSVHGAPRGLQLAHVMGSWAPWAAALAALLPAGVGASADLVWLARAAAPIEPMADPRAGSAVLAGAPAPDVPP